jgi:hypothetical protein
MAVAFDAFGAGGNTTASPTTWSHTASTSTNSVVVAVVSWTGTLYTSCSATYGGTTMTQIASLPYNNSGTSSRLLAFYLLSPATGAQTVSITVTVSGATPTAGTTTRLQGNTISYTGVTGIGNAFTAFGTTGTTMSMNSASYKGMMMNVFANSGTTSPSGTGVGYTSTLANGASGNYAILGYATDNASSTTFSATMSSAAPWAGITVPVQGTTSVNETSIEVNKTVAGGTVPAGTLGCYVTLIGGGGGGGSGAARNGTTLPSGWGGSGGGGGAIVRRVYVPSSLLGSTYSVAVGSGGPGGPVSTAGTPASATPGTAGGTSSFTSGSTTISVTGGAGGKAAVTSSDSLTGGTGGTYTVPGGLAYEVVENGATGGDAPKTQTAATAGTASTYAGAGGGGGAPQLTNAYGGGVGGASLAATPGGASTGTAGQAGGVPISAPPGFGGAGGGGGNSVSGFSNTAPGGAGGLYGGGGGGGAGKEGNFASTGEAGGAGGAGFTKIEWLFGDNNFMNFFPM